VRRVSVALVALLAACSDTSQEPANRDGGGFVDRTEEAGIGFVMKFLPTEQGANFKINLYDHGSGVALGDVDGDGDDDLYLLNQLGANALYRNDGDGTFTDVTEEAGVGLADRICVSAAFNDVDNDGDQDLFVTSTRGGNALFENDGEGRFTNVTATAGVWYVGHSQGATFFDADGDGDLDLLVTNTAGWTTEALHPHDRYYLGVPDIFTLVQSPIEHNVYYRNVGGMKFEEATGEAGLRGVGWGGDHAVFDHDGDGDLDVFIGNMFGRSVLYENDGGGRFRDVTGATLGRTPWGTVGARAFDYDNDGQFDLFVVDMHSDMWTPVDWDAERIEEHRKYKWFHGGMIEDPRYRPWMESKFAQLVNLPYDETFFGNGLYRNTGGGKFEEVSDEAGVETYWPWGVMNGDFDNDGFQDVFLASGMGFPYFYWRSYLLMNDRDGTFTDRSRTAGIDPPPGGVVLGEIAGRHAVRSARSATVGDLDGDGRLDMVVNNFNDRPNLFMNRWPKRSWIAFRLRGTRSNRDAVGAVVRVRRGDRTWTRMVQAAGGYLAQSSKTVHIGLGDLDAVDRCEIRWPSGTVQVLEAPETNRLHEVEEPSE